MAALIGGRYEPTGDSFSGGMSDVFECKDTHLDRSVVIKRLQSDQEARRLLDEQKALLKLRSKHVVQMYDLVELPPPRSGSRGIVLEYISGSELQCPGYSPEGNDYLKILWQIACGVRDIHRAGIIHRDLKPNNMRIDSEGTVKIFDFGLARDLGDAAVTIGRIGTPAFMAPELWRNGTTSFDQSIDVYAFGVTALALAVPGLEAVNTYVGLHAPIAFPSGLIAEKFLGVPAHLSPLLERCLDHDHRTRPTMKVVVAHLEKYLLQGRHRALLTLTDRVLDLNNSKRMVILRLGQASIQISYDGFEFRITAFSGTILINNIAAQLNQTLPTSCVIGLTDGSLKMQFFPFDVSNPEVLA
jgi:serine/threonine protein kinase